MDKSVQPSISLLNSLKVNIKSKNVDQEYEIRISIPPSYKNSGIKYPILYLLDSNWYFTPITGILSYLYDFNALEPTIPEIILVGISYPSATFTDIVSYRSRDYLPETDNEIYKQFLVPLGCDPNFYPNSGGAPEFLQFITEELMPYMDSNYRVNADDKTIAGHSYGGLFSSYVLFTKPETFHRYVISSPSLWYKDGACFRYEEEYSKKHDALNARVFIGVGANETDKITNYVERVRRLVDTLNRRQYKGLAYEWVIFSDEDHFSVIPAAFMRGILSVYEPNL